MTYIEIFLIGLGLSMDCFAVSLGMGATRKLQWADILKMAFFFGFFQGVMPFLGWLIGQSIQTYIASVDHWIAFGILAFIGGRMIYESFKIGEEKRTFDIRKNKVLITLSIATSIDALATGISLGFIRVSILRAVVTISLITFIVSITGARIGHNSTFIPARWAERAGGAVLVLIGARILLEHLGIL